MNNQSLSLRWLIAIAVLAASVVFAQNSVQAKSADSKAEGRLSEAYDNQVFSLPSLYSKSDFLEPVTRNKCGQKIVDRDNNSYTTVQVGKQCWMGENLKTKTWPSGITLTMASNISERDCITTSNTRGTESDCQAGRTLYAAGIDSSICPTGWHIPNDAELARLEQSLTSVGQDCAANRGWRTYGGVCIIGDPVADACFNAGKQLKVGGPSGFNWQLTGVRQAAPFGNVIFAEAGQTGYLLSATGGGCGFPSYFGSAGINVRAVNVSSDGVQRMRLGMYPDPGNPNFQLPAAPLRCVRN